MKGLVIVLTTLFNVTVGEDLCWSTFGDYQYKVLAPSGGAVFDDAVDYCRNINTTLASIHSKQEDTFLQRFVMTQMGVPLWIGLRRENEGLSWADESEVDYVDASYKRKETRVTPADACPTTTVSAPTSSGRVTSSTEVKTVVSSTDTGTFQTVTVSQEDATEDGHIETTSEEGSTRGDIPSASYSVSPESTVVHTTTDRVTSLTDHATSDTQTTSLTPLQTTVAPAPEITTEHKQTFAEMLDEMTVKKKPVYEIREGANSTAIGSVSIMILVGILVGVILLDLNTIKKHLSMIKQNTKDVCKRHNKVDVIYVK